MCSWVIRALARALPGIGGGGSFLGREGSISSSSYSFPLWVPEVFHLQDLLAEF